jgi:hypothetical protein
MTVNNSVISSQGTDANAYGTSINISSGNQVSASYSYYEYNYFNIDISGLLLDGNWHLLNITRKDNAFKLYIDGVYHVSYSSSSSISSADNYPMYIGKGFTGKMDNLRVYNRELTQSEIMEIFNAKQ